MSVISTSSGVNRIRLAHHISKARMVTYHFYCFCFFRNNIQGKFPKKTVQLNHKLTSTHCGPFFLALTADLWTGGTSALSWARWARRWAGKRRRREDERCEVGSCFFLTVIKFALKVSLYYACDYILRLINPRVCRHLLVLCWQNSRGRQEDVNKRISCHSMTTSFIQL